MTEWNHNEIGKYIVGKKYLINAIKNILMNDNYIVEIADGEILLLVVRKNRINSLYALARVNPNTKIEKPIIYDVELINIASIMWLRRSSCFPKSAVRM